MGNLRRPKEKILGPQDVEAILKGELDELVLAVRDGKEHYARAPLDLLIPFRKRTKANMLNDSIVDAASKRLEGHPGVHFLDEHESRFFLFGDDERRVALRYKKLDPRDCTANVGTRRQTEIDFHQREFEGSGGTTIVTLGYMLNKLWTEISTIKLICKRGDETLWTIPLVKGTAESALPLVGQTSTQDYGPLVRSSIVQDRKAKG